MTFMETQSPESNRQSLSPLEKAIQSSEIGMALTSTSDGKLILVHMSEDEAEEVGSFFDGTIWIYTFSMVQGIVPDASFYPLQVSSYGDRELQLTALRTIGVDTERGWMSVPNALL